VALLKRRDLIKKLEDAGYRKEREGDHTIYEKPGCRSLQVPRHREINENTARAILKTAGLK
jgi:mRNA interferase HicA